MRNNSIFVSTFHNLYFWIIYQTLPTARLSDKIIRIHSFTMEIRLWRWEKNDVIKCNFKCLIKLCNSQKSLLLQLNQLCKKLTPGVIEKMYLSICHKFTLHITLNICLSQMDEHFKIDSVILRQKTRKLKKNQALPLAM